MLPPQASPNAPHPPRRILVVDDQARPRRALAEELADAGAEVLEASDGQEAWEIFQRKRPHLVITDMVMPHSDGMELLRRIRTHSEVPVIVFTAYGSVASAVSALKAGAEDFVISSDIGIDDLVNLVHHVLQREGSEPPRDLLSLLPGRSVAIARVRRQVAGLAPVRTSVLVSGEIGTGRGTVVRTLHELGSTAGTRLVRVEAADLDAGRGLPEAGALHVEDVERLAPEAQILFEGLVEQTATLAADRRPRLLATTRVNLLAAVENGSLRPGLGRALLRFHVVLPPLRRRLEDIPLLCDALLARLGAVLGRPRLRLSPEALELLAAQSWPENVAGLRAVIERAILFTREHEIRAAVIREVLDDLEESLASIREARRTNERDALVQAIRQTGGNITHTAELLGRSRAAVYRMISKHGIALDRPEKG